MSRRSQTGPDCAERSPGRPAPGRGEARPITGRASGFLVGSAPLAAVIVLAARLGEGASASRPAVFVPALAVALVQAGGGLLGPRMPRASRLLVTAGWALALAILLPHFDGRPSLALIAALAATTLSAIAWGSSLSSPPRASPRKDRPGSAALAALVGAVVVAIGTLLAGLPSALTALPAAAASTFVVLMVLARSWERRRASRPALVVLSLAPPTAALLLPSAPEAAVALGLCAAGLSVAGGVASGPRRAAPGAGGWADLALGDPARSMVVSFLALGVVGGWLLALPVASSRGVAVGLLDGLFTAFSAVCVTGLVVLDTPRDFGTFGHAVILVLIQVGGLGIMAFSTAGFALLGRRLTLKQELAAAALLGTEDQAHLRGLLRDVLLVTVWSEGLGTAVLSALFLRAGDPLATALWRGLFTSVSAFCNAGFALQSDSLVPYREDPLLLVAVATLIVIGGLGPFVVATTGRRLRGVALPLHPRVVLVTTACLVVGGALLVGASEWAHGLAELPPWHRVTNALFQSVTLRTAGFNSVDLGALQPATVVFMISMMIVGGSPGSTAGGVKTTTLATMLLVVRAAARGEDAPRVAGYRLSRGTVQRASAVAAISVLTALGFSLMLLLTQRTPALETVFEAVSALGTVGLSLGVTGALDEVGKVVVIAAMFAGRVGPLTLFLFLSGRRSREPALQPERELPAG